MVKGDGGGRKFQKKLAHPRSSSVRYAERLTVLTGAAGVDYDYLYISHCTTLGGTTHLVAYVNGIVFQGATVTQKLLQSPR